MNASFRNSEVAQHEASIVKSAISLPHHQRKSVVLAQETPVALVFNGTTAAVMMGSPSDIHDLALGFALSEGFIHSPDEIAEFEQVAHQKGIEARFWLTTQAAERSTARRRAMMGPVGCGLCGVDSLEQAARPAANVANSTLQISKDEVTAATVLLRDHQMLHDRTRAAHAAGFLRPGRGIVTAREDIGRHNALDKLLGALIQSSVDPSSGAVVMTSRVSVELVQKTTMLGCPMLIAVSAPTAYAVELADQAGLTLVANAKGDKCDVFAHPRRIY